MPKKTEPPRFLARGLTRDMLPSWLPVADRRPRRLITRSGNRVRGEYAVDGPTDLQWESPVEQDAILLIRLSRRVRHVFCQPAVLVIEDNHYTPDILVFLTCGTRIWIECKTAKELEDTRVQQRLEVITQQFTVWREPFCLLTDSALEELGATVRNARYLQQWRVGVALPSEFPAGGSIQEIEAVLGQECAWAAVAYGLYEFDWRQDIDRKTCVTLRRAASGYEPPFLDPERYSASATLREADRASDLQPLAARASQ